MPRVVVTGMGVISALGRGCAPFSKALRAGESGIGPIREQAWPPLKITMLAEVKDFAPAEHFDRSQMHLLDRFAQLGVVAAREAFAQSRLAPDGAWREAAGAIIGSCVGGQTTEDSGYLELYRNGRTNVSPFTVPRIMANAPASRISVELGLHGPAFAVSSACASANHALGISFQLVRSGSAEVMITGGSEAPITFGHLKAWEALRIVAPDTCRPFSAGRRGMILGEGAAILVLESLDHARARNATILGEIVGSGMSSDAGHITQPSVDGAALAMRRALADAGLAPGQIDYINAHGTGTKINDAVEARAIHSVFGAGAATLPVSSTKSLHGHALGAAGALEAVATLIALEEGFIPPTAGFIGADPECPLDVVPNHSREARLRCALSNSFAFGGLNAVLAFRRWEQEG